MKYFQSRPIRHALFATFLLASLFGCASSKPEQAPTKPGPVTVAPPSAEIITQEKPKPAEVFEARLKSNPKDIEALYGKALVLRADGNNKEASSTLLKVLGLDKNFAPAHATLGSILLEEEKSREARTAFSRSLELSPGNPEANKGLGTLALASGNWADAVTYFSKALESDRDPYVFADRAKAWSELGQYRNAETDYALALQELNQDPFLFLDRGRMRARNGATAGALEDFNKVLELRPDYTLVKYYRGQIHDQLFNSKAAIEDFEAVLKEKPNYVPVLENLAILYLEAGRFSEAGQLMEKTWDPLKKNDRSLLMATAMRFLDPNKANRESARLNMEKVQNKLDQSGILYQVSRSYVDSKLEDYVLGQVSKLPKGDEKALAQILMAAASKRSGFNSGAEALALDSKDRFGLETTEGRIGAFIRNESRVK